MLVKENIPSFENEYINYIFKLGQRINCGQNLHNVHINMIDLNLSVHWKKNNTVLDQKEKGGYHNQNSTLY